VGKKPKVIRAKLFLMSFHTNESMESNVLKGKKLTQAIAVYNSGKVAKKQLRAETLKKRRKFLVRLERFLNTVGWVFNEQTARGFIDSLRTRKDGKPSALTSIKTYIGDIRAFNRWCIDQGYLTVHFTQWIPKPPEAETMPEPLNLSGEVIDRAIILGTEPGQYDNKSTRFKKSESRIILQFFRKTGRRRSEVFNLRGSDLHSDDVVPCYWYTQKGGKRVTRPIPADMVNEMRKRQHKEKVFEVTPETTIQHLRNGLEIQGIKRKIVNHSLRKLFAIERNKNGETIYNIAKALGNTVKIVEEHYLSSDISSIADTVNNSMSIRNGLSIGKNIDAALKSLRNIFKGRRYKKVQLIMKDGKITFEIALTDEGKKEMDSSE
jgi:site-specific recombinase XerD